LSLKANNGNSRPTDSISWVFVALNTGIDHCGHIAENSHECQISLDCVEITW
jgi:hypothetical protein